MTEERISMLAKLFELAEKLTAEEWTVLTAYADGMVAVAQMRKTA